MFYHLSYNSFHIDKLERTKLNQCLSFARGRLKETSGQRPVLVEVDSYEKFYLNELMN